MLGTVTQLWLPIRILDIRTKVAHGHDMATTQNFGYQSERCRHSIHSLVSMARLIPICLPMTYVVLFATERPSKVLE